MKTFEFVISRNGQIIYACELTAVSVQAAEEAFRHINELSYISGPVNVTRREMPWA